MNPDPYDGGLVARDLRKSYGAQLVLDGANLRVAPGELVAVMGESGSGKSTLLNLIAGLDDPDAGEVRIGGTSLAGLDDDARSVLRRERLGFVFQSFNLLPHLRVADNVGLPLLLLRTPAAERENRVAGLLEALGLAGLGGRWPRELSGGEQQRVAIARALAHRPALVLADEPTGSLDADTAAVVLELMTRELRARGAAALLVTHSAAAAALADRVLVLSRGRLAPRTPDRALDQTRDQTRDSEP